MRRSALQEPALGRRLAELLKLQPFLVDALAGPEGEDGFVGRVLHSLTEQSDTSFQFNVVKCRYAETYKAMGLGEIGHLLSCNRDGAFCEGYDPKLKLERTQTIMQGASHCDFKYRFED